MAKRVSKLQNAVSNLANFPKMVIPLHVYSCQRGERKLTADWDSTLEKMKNLDLKNAAGGKLSFRSALTFDQRARN